MASASEEILTPISAETPVAVASSTATTKDFSHSILEKLKKSNYLLRCQQVEPVIKRHHIVFIIFSPIHRFHCAMRRLPIVMLEKLHLSFCFENNRISSCFRASLGQASFTFSVYHSWKEETALRRSLKYLS